MSLESRLNRDCDCSAEESSDKRMLTESLSLARDILNYINRQVDEHEKEQRLFTIYNKLDARSYTLVNGSKFKVIPLLALAFFKGLSTLVPETGYFVALFGNKVSFFRIQSILFREPVWTGLN